MKGAEVEAVEVVATGEREEVLSISSADFFFLLLRLAAAPMGPRRTRRETKGLGTAGAEDAAGSTDSPASALPSKDSVACKCCIGRESGNCLAPSS